MASIMLVSASVTLLLLPAVIALMSRWMVSEPASAPVSQTSEGVTP
jgi:hypothetical protein